MSHRKVIVTQRFFDEEAIAFLEGADCHVEILDLPAGKGDGDLTKGELVEALRDAEGWIVGHSRVDGELLAELPDLKVISRRGVGYDRIDIDAVEASGKVACIAVGGNHESVADHTIAMMLAVGHRFRETQTDLESGVWKILQGSDLYRKTVGIIGMGRIGTALARRLTGFECEILAVTDGDLPSDAPDGVVIVDFPTLLERSDYVSVHAPLTDATRLMFGEDAFKRMKSSSILINAARGGLVDDAALLSALERGIIAGAGLDTFQSESDPSLAPVTEKLVTLPNVVATPHAAASTREGLARTNMVASQCVVAVLDGDHPADGCVIADGRESPVR